METKCTESSQKTFSKDIFEIEKQFFLHQYTEIILKYIIEL